MVESRKTLYLVLWIFGLTFLFAVVANIIVLCPSPIKLEVAGDANDWIGFYAGAFASLISSGMAFYILHITYKQNEKNHHEQKELQRKSLIYVEKMNAFRKIVELLSELKPILDANEFEYIENRYMNEVNTMDKKSEYEIDFKNIEKNKLNVERLCFNISIISKISFSSQDYTAFMTDINRILESYKVLASKFKNHKYKLFDDYYDVDNFITITEWNFVLEIEDFPKCLDAYKNDLIAFNKNSNISLLTMSKSLDNLIE